MKADIVFIFLLLLAFILVTYWVGTASDALALAKGGQQIIYYLQGRNPSGGWG